MNKVERQQELAEIDSKVKEDLEDVFNNPDTDSRPDLKKMIDEYLQQLETTHDVDEVAPELCQRIAQEYITNNKNFPMSIVDLYYKLRIMDSRYDGVKWSDTQAGLIWFE